MSVFTDALKQELPGAHPLKVERVLRDADPKVAKEIKAALLDQSVPGESLARAITKVVGEHVSGTAVKSWRERYCQ